MSDWEPRSQSGPNGELIEFFERPKPGAPGVVERSYPNGSPERLGSAPGTMKLLRPGARPRYRAPAVSGLGVTRGRSSVTPTVWMTSGAFSDLERCILGSPTGMETGGALFGSVRGGAITITEVTVACSEHNPSHCLIDAELIDKQAARRREADDGLVLCGTWHREPGIGDSKPSKADLKHWASWTRAGEQAHFVGVTVRAPNSWFLGWRDAQARAYVFSRTSQDVEISAVIDLQGKPWTL